MNKKIAVFVLIIVAILITYPFIDISEQRFEIYLATGTSNNLDEFVLSSKPVVTDEDILSYNWNTHEIVFSESYLSSIQMKSPNQSTSLLTGFSINGGSKLLGASYKDKFVIVVNGERIYSGHFPKPLHSSSMNGSPLIVDRFNGIAIEFLYGQVDMRSDRRILNVLRRKGKLD